MSRLIALDWNPSDRVLRHFGIIVLIGALGLAAMAWFQAWVFGFGLGAAREPVTFGCLGVGLCCGLASWVAPRANRAPYLALSMVTYPIGFLLSHLLLGLLFFGLLAPLGIALRLCGRDSMHRHPDPNAKSYWIARRPARRRDAYFRQF